MTDGPWMGATATETAGPGSGTGPGTFGPQIPIPLALPHPPVPGVPLAGPMAMVMLLRAYRDRQKALARSTADGIGNLWQAHMRPDDFAGSWRGLKPLISGLIENHFDASAAEAARTYQMARVLSDYSYVPIPGQKLDPVQLERSMGTMAGGTFFRRIDELGVDGASARASEALQGAGTRLTLRGGRQTMVEAANSDPAALGWERLIDADACSFCSMLAGRGGVYKETTVEFRAHDHCNCTAAPVFRGQEAQGAALAKEWRKATKGTSGKASLKAWDEYWGSRAI
jgi:hypothetical protein